MPMPRLALILALAVLAIGVMPGNTGGGSWPTLAAWADDDDDDDGGDDDDDDDGAPGPGFSRGDFGFDRLGRPRGARAPGRGRPAAAPPAFAPELVVLDLSETELLDLLASGFGLLQRILLSEGSLTRLDPPPGTPLEAARALVRALPSAPAADFNHYYRPGQDAFRPAGVPAPEPCGHANCNAWDLIGWPAGRAAIPGCAVTVPVGVIDTGVNPDHDQLQGARIEVARLAGAGAPPSGAAHGTAVVSLLVGQQGQRVAGLIPEAGVIAIDIFARQGGDERAEVVALVLALESMAGRGVRLVNLSLSGPENAVLTRTLDRLSGPGGLVAVAAVGNAGPEAPAAWPAAHPGVLAVTAVDGRGRLYGGAQRGPHVDLAAPGVNLLAATSVRGARAQSGTSFAAPFVTAAAAILLSRSPGLDVAALRQRLGADARDLGAAGRDPLYGAGLISAQGLCG